MQYFLHCNPASNCLQLRALWMQYFFDPSVLADFIFLTVCDYITSVIFYSKIYFRILMNLRVSCVFILLDFHDTILAFAIYIVQCTKRTGWDSNPRDCYIKRFSRPPRYDRFDTCPVITSQ